MQTIRTDPDKLGPAPGLYYGYVDSTFVPNGTVMVRLDRPSVHEGPKYQCQWAAGIVSSLLGFRMNYLPPVNTKVVVMLTGREINYIIGSVPEGMVRPGLPGEVQQRTATGAGAPNYAASQIFSSSVHDRAQAFNAHGPAVDLVEGELQLDNLAGVGISLLRHLASLQAGDLARVECHLMDDMVRIISDTFQHYTAFGDFKISNDGGKLNVIWQGTSHDHEAWGLLKANDAKMKLKPKSDTTLDFSEVDGESDDGRWRFTQYLGELGNFIQLWVTDPVEGLGKLAAGQVRAGKARLHVNNDGSVLVQSVADIVLEKVVAIPVPNQLKHEDDPHGDLSDGAPASLDPLKTWKPSDQANLFEMAFQLREYARWLNNSYSLGRFRQRRLDYEVPTEQATFNKGTDVNNREVDRAEVNKGVNNWRLAYACIRIYRDGSIQTVDAYGNAITTTKTGVQISSASDLLLEAAGSINMVAGRDVNILARKNVNLTAVKEQIRLKAQTGLAMLVSAGHAVIELISNRWLKIIGQLNVNNAVALQANGDVVAGGTVTGQHVAAVANDPALMDDSGDMAVDSFYVEKASAADVPSVDAKFEFQSNYGATQQYESLTQQALRHEEQPSEGVWAFSENAVSGKGSPWPGTGVKQKISDGGTTLQQPSGAAAFSAEPKPMVDRTKEIRYQS